MSQSRHIPVVCVEQLVSWPSNSPCEATWRPTLAPGPAGVEGQQQPRQKEAERERSSRRTRNVLGRVRRRRVRGALSGFFLFCVSLVTCQPPGLCWRRRRRPRERPECEGEREKAGRDEEGEKW